ncbi:hypothetical protein QVD17_11677 [Tagetes erecta]|uniref:Uncharacterized protein n=1 Tax=Tagetes erecta TaxID=13708 RepID=A0AAD8P143_TARER|nr:hypothetical protein QVD17_11677 [Tagetes erecta]
MVRRAGMLQMVSEPVVGRCASEDAGLPRGVDWCREWWRAREECQAHHYHPHEGGNQDALRGLVLDNKLVDLCSFLVCLVFDEMKRSKEEYPPLSKGQRRRREYKM